jgi:hypothetical protein
MNINHLVPQFHWLPGYGPMGRRGKGKLNHVILTEIFHAGIQRTGPNMAITLFHSRFLSDHFDTASIDTCCELSM